MSSTIIVNNDDINAIKKIQEDTLSVLFNEKENIITRLQTYVDQVKNYILNKYNNNDDIREVLNCIDKFINFCSNHYPVSKKINNENVLLWNTENIGMLYTYFVRYVKSKRKSILL